MDSLNERVERVYSYLLRHFGSGAAAAFFRDAGVILGDPPPLLTTSAHLASHAMREAESAVRASLWGMVTQEPDERDECGRPRISKSGKMQAILDYLGVKESGVKERWDAHTKEAPRQAHRDGLREPRPVDSAVHQRWTELVDILDLLMRHFEARYPDVFAHLDELLRREAPTKANLAWLSNSCPPTHAARSHFFGRLKEPGWLRGLESKGFFEKPPPPVTDDEGRISIPDWPEGHYLAAVSPILPEAVAGILASVATKNVRVRDQVLGIAATLPAQHARRVVEKAECWIGDLLEYRWFESGFVALAVTLAEAGHGEDALRMVGALLDASAARAEQQGIAIFGDNESAPPAFRKEGAKLLLELANHLGVEALELVARALDARFVGCCRAELVDRESDGTELGDPDFSSVWLPDLTSQPTGGRADDMRSFLATNLLLMLEVVVGDGSELDSIWALLERRRSKLFRRLTLQVALNGYPATRSSALKLFGDTTAMLAEIEVWREFGQLLEVAFKDLDSPTQARILKAIHAPAIDGTESGPEAQRQREECERNWLHLIRGHLPTTSAKRLGDLLARLGPPVPPWATRSLPLVADGGWIEATFEFDGESPEQVFSILEEVDAAAVRPAALALCNAVATRPAEFTSHVHLLRGSRPEFITAYAEGLIAAARGGASSFDWTPVLAVVAGDLSHAADAPDAGRLLRAATRLVIEGFRASLEAPAVPHAWSVIQEVFAQAPAENPPQDVDATIHSINSARSLAVDAVIRLALWCSESDELALANRAFDCLTKELAAPESVLARTVLGRFLPLLIDRAGSWLEDNLDLVFPKPSGRGDLGAVVFDAYLKTTKPYAGVLPLLEPEYRRAIERLSEPLARSEEKDERDGLGKHLSHLYGWGFIPLEDGSLLADFLETAPATRRAAVLHFVGWSLVNTDTDPGVRFIGRWQKLWDWHVRRPDVTNNEVAEFGWWFSSRFFPEDWALSRLREALARVGIVEWEHATAEYLSELATRRIAEVLSVMHEFDPTGGGERWRVSHWLDEAEKIFRLGLASSEEGVREKALAELGRWIAHDHLQLLSLRDPQAEDGSGGG